MSFLATKPPIPGDASTVPPSPLHKIISKLPSPISVKRVASTQPTTSPCPEHKKRKASEGSTLSSPDMRRDILVKKIRQKLSSGVTISLMATKQVNDDSEILDNSVEIISDTNDNDSLTLEERDAKDSKPVDFNAISDKSNSGEVVDDNKTVTDNATELKLVKPKVVKKKTEIQWRIVKRNKRKTRFFLFKSTAEGEKDEVTIEKADNNQRVPRVINGRRPYIVVPGVEYDLEEGEGVIMDTEDDEAEIRLARNEKYEMDSFVCDTGYLSDDEMMETPTADKVASKVKQQRRANNIQAKLKFERIGEPEVLGCLWWNGKGGQKLKMKKWQAIIFCSSPIPTSFTNPIPEDDNQCPQLLPPPPPPPMQPVLPTPPSSLTDLATKYHVKYLVKHLVQRAMMGGGPTQCSTPMPGRAMLATQSSLTMQVVDQGDELLRENRELMEKYVTKYFNKFKYQV